MGHIIKVTTPFAFVNIRKIITLVDMAKKPTKRAKKYDPKLAVKEGTEWSDLIALSLQPTKKKAAPKSKKKK